MTWIESVLNHIFTKYRWAIHVFYWLVVAVAYFIFFGYRFAKTYQTILFVGFLMPVVIGSTYLLNYYLIPSYLLKERYWTFIQCFIYMLIGAIYIEMWIVIFVFMSLADALVSNMSQTSINIFALLASLLAVIFSGGAIKLLLHWRQSKEDYQKLLVEKMEAELRFLKTQLNPHFLFNTLNNLYYLTTEKSDKAPRAVLALSELLNYTLKNSKVDLVDLNEEVEQSRNFIALESLRYEDRLNVDFRVDGQKNNFRIAPMLLITLIENAFKHGVMTITGEAWMKLNVVCDADQLRIKLINNKGDGNNSSQSGIGLQNLKNQLDLLYKARHTINIQDLDDTFTVELILHEG